MSSAVGITKSMITWPLVTMILVSVSCSAFAQISLKHAMSVRSVHSAIIDGEPAEIALAVAASPMLWLGLSCTASAHWCGCSFWLALMYRWPMRSLRLAFC